MDTFKFGSNLKLHNENNGFAIYDINCNHNDKNQSPLFTILIKQNNGIDAEDRISVLKAGLENIENFKADRQKAGLFEEGQRTIFTMS